MSQVNFKVLKAEAPEVATDVSTVGKSTKISIDITFHKGIDSKVAMRLKRRLESKIQKLLAGHVGFSLGMNLSEMFDHAQAENTDKD
jgi:hypothetical protein